MTEHWSPHRSPRSAHLKKNIKMSNFAPCGLIFKIRNSKLVYSKSYKQLTDYIFSITSTFRLLLCYFVHFYTYRNRIWKNQHCSPTVHWLKNKRQSYIGNIHLLLSLSLTSKCQPTRKPFLRKWWYKALYDCSLNWAVFSWLLRLLCHQILRCLYKTYSEQINIITINVDKIFRWTFNFSIQQINII